jgi:putative transposase
LVEAINGLYQTEVMHRRGPRRSFEAVDYATLEWVDCFDHRLMREFIGNIRPPEAEDQYHAAASNRDMAA